MVTLRCTQKLLRKLRARTESGTLAPTTALGDWYANILYSRPQQLVLCISERTLLPVVTVVKEVDLFPLRLATAVQDVLAHLGVPQALIEREIRKMRGFAYGPTQSKRVLGSMNDFMFQLSWLLHDRPGLSLVEMTPCGPIGYKSPDDFTRELFRSGLSSAHAIH